MTSAEQSTQKQTYWDQVYQNQGIKDLNWTQDEATSSINLVKRTGLQKDDPIIDVGSGSSVLVKNLVEKGYLNVIATDISEKALAQNKERLGANAEKVHWVIDDVTNPQKLHEVGKVGLWHDRAVFHFLTDFKERLNYFALMNQTVKEEGFVILSAFNHDAPNECSGLAIRKYDEEGLKSFMGPGYRVIKCFDVNEKAPNGTERSYIYALFQRIPFVDME